jgi:hypothetical protein
MRAQSERERERAVARCRSDPKGDKVQCSVTHVSEWCLDHERVVHHSGRRTHAPKKERNRKAKKARRRHTRTHTHTHTQRQTSGGGTSVGERRKGFNARCHSAERISETIGWWSSRVPSQHASLPQTSVREIEREKEMSKHRGEPTVPLSRHLHTHTQARLRGSVQVCCFLSGAQLPKQPRASWIQMQSVCTSLPPQSLPPLSFVFSAARAPQPWVLGSKAIFASWGRPWRVATIIIDAPRNITPTTNTHTHIRTLTCSTRQRNKQRPTPLRSQTDRWYNAASGLIS